VSDGQPDKRMQDMITGLQVSGIDAENDRDDSLPS
jgi:hypothetical protein